MQFDPHPDTVQFYMASPIFCVTEIHWCCGAIRNAIVPKWDAGFHGFNRWFSQPCCHSGARENALFALPSRLTDSMRSQQTGTEYEAILESPLMKSPEHVLSHLVHYSISPINDHVVNWSGFPSLLGYLLFLSYLAYDTDYIQTYNTITFFNDYQFL